MTAKILSGSCVCQRISYDCLAAPKEEGSTICHCKTCRKLSGGPYQVYVGMHSKDILWFDNIEHLRYEGLPIESVGGIRIIRVSTIADRPCCATCGSWLGMRYNAKPDTTYIALGCVDMESVTSRSVRKQLETHEEIFCAQRAEWLAKPAAEKRFPGMPPSFE